MTMSEKDKNTIIIAVVALLIFGIAFLGIKPAFSSIKETKATNAELSAQKETMKTEIESLPTYKTNLEAAKKDYKETANRVYGDLTNDKIHDEVVAFVKDCGLNITSLSIGGKSPQSIANYTIAEGVGAGGPIEGSVNLADISVTVSGTKAQLITLIDKLNTTEGTYLQTVSFSDTEELVSTSVSFLMVLADAFE